MYPSLEDKMPAFDASVRDDLERLEAIHAFRLGVSVAVARKTVARETKVAPGTLENIKRQRTKGVRGWIGDAIRGALVHALQKEIERLTHELQILNQRGVDRREPEMAEVESLLARARKSLGEVK
jgi:DNA-binding transcriptional MerR regulator